MTFAEKLSRLVQQDSIKQNDIVRAMPRKGRGCANKDKVSRWLSGKSRPDIHAALALARFLGVTMEWLADDTMGWPPVGPNERDRAVLAAIRAREKIEGRELTADEVIYRIFRGEGK